MYIEIKDATVIALQNEQVKMNSGEMRDKQTATLIVNGRNAETHGVEIWDDNIARMALKQGEQVTLKCDLRSRMWGGKWLCTLIAWGVEHKNVEQTQEGGTTDPFEL